MDIPLGLHGNDNVGIILNDHVYRSTEDRIKTLQQIHNPQFQQLLTEGVKEHSNVEDLIKTTEFIPAYPLNIHQI
ncbi:MAG: hypothetical protein RCG15_00810 [Candidatus Rickettsia vulgarisii]